MKQGPSIYFNSNSTIKPHFLEEEQFIETVTAVDAQGDEIPTSQIVITGSVDPTIPGSYGLTYNVSDSQGNAADEV